jgi:hypothetical protein
MDMATHKKRLKDMKMKVEVEVEVDPQATHNIAVILSGR